MKLEMSTSSIPVRKKNRKMPSFSSRSRCSEDSIHQMPDNLRTGPSSIPAVA